MGEVLVICKLSFNCTIAFHLFISTRLTWKVIRSQTFYYPMMQCLYMHSVVISVPLGVLKAENISFIPPLPLRKVDAIHRLGMGLENRVALHFKKVSWW